jgi:hypothetical protein
MRAESDHVARRRLSDVDGCARVRECSSCFLSTNTYNVSPEDDIAAAGVSHSQAAVC